ncbi:MAG: hypothetical protein AB2809_17075 [Candidatus Thiodiazotropha sp.]
MPKLLFVKSGDHEEPVTKVLKKNIYETRSIIKSKRLKYLGLVLSPIGEESRMADFAGPVHVVLEVSESEAVELADICTGFHLVEELKPAEVT